MAASPYSINSEQRKIDPYRKPEFALKPDGTPDDNDRVEIGPTALAFEEWEALGLECPQLDTLREFRLQRLVNELQKRDYGGIVLFDPLNIRYATDTTNMQLWITHNPARACFVAASAHIARLEVKERGAVPRFLDQRQVRRQVLATMEIEQGDMTTRRDETGPRGVVRDP